MQEIVSYVKKSLKMSQTYKKGTRNLNSLTNAHKNTHTHTHTSITQAQDQLITYNGRGTKCT